MEQKKGTIMYKTKEIDLLLSLILGDGSIYKQSNSYNMYIGHGEKQKDYLQWKIDLLNKYIFDNTLSIHSKITSLLKDTNKKYLQFYVTKTDKKFKQLYDIYNNENDNRLTTLLKNIKSDRSVAIWFMDDGSVFKRKRKLKNGTITYDAPTLKLCTHCFSKDENLQIIDWFKRRYLIEAKLVSETKRGVKYYYLRFNKNESLKIFKTIRIYVDEISSMKEKFKFFYDFYNL